MAARQLQRKERQRIALGMDHGTAANRLRKALMFSMAQRLDMTNCYRCGHEIVDLAEFSIDHKEVWENTDRAADLFFALDNVAFSHFACNVAASRKSKIYENRTAKAHAKYLRVKADPVRYTRKMVLRENRRAQRRALGLPIDIRLEPGA